MSAVRQPECQQKGPSKAGTLLDIPPSYRKGTPSRVYCRPLQQEHSSDSLPGPCTAPPLQNLQIQRSKEISLVSEQVELGGFLSKFPEECSPTVHSIQSVRGFPTAHLPRTVRAIGMTSSKMPLQISHISQTEWSLSSPSAKFSAIYKPNEFLTKSIVRRGSAMAE